MDTKWSMKTETVFFVWRANKTHQTKKGNQFLLRTTPKQEFQFAKLRGFQWNSTIAQTSGLSKPYYRDLENSLPLDLKTSD